MKNCCKIFVLTWIKFICQNLICRLMYFSKLYIKPGTNCIEIKKDRKLYLKSKILFGLRNKRYQWKFLDFLYSPSGRLFSEIQPFKIWFLSNGHDNLPLPFVSGSCSGSKTCSKYSRLRYKTYLICFVHLRLKPWLKSYESKTIKYFVAGHPV